jgi:hypothetical protein
MTIELTPDEARLLVDHLKIYLDHLDKEVAHTDRYELQHALARDERGLTSIFARLNAAVGSVANGT